jgi:hypothetical protein
MAVLCVVLEEPPYFFPEWLHQLAFPLAVYEGSFFPASSPTFVVGGVLDDSYFNRWNVNMVLICISNSQDAPLLINGLRKCGIYIQWSYIQP